MINLVLLADKSFVEESISQMLKREGDFKMIASISTYNELAEIRRHSKLDVLIIDQDIVEHAGLHVAENLKYSPDLKTILLTESSKTVLTKYFNSPLNGFVCKDSATEELAFAIRHVADGNRYVCTTLVLPFLNDYLQRSNNMPEIEPAILTPREKEILALIAEGYTNQEIAGKLSTSKRTVEGHRLSLINKTGSRNTASLIKFALNHKLISDSLNLEKEQKHSGI